MKIINGTSVVAAASRGTIYYYQRDELDIGRHKVSDTELEMRRFLVAKAASSVELDALYEEALERLGEENAQIFFIHQVMIDDDQFGSGVAKYIKDKGYNAEYAVSAAASDLIKGLAQNGSEYLRERVMDVRDISDRIIRHLLNAKTTRPEIVQGTIICADTIMPSEAMMFDRTKIVGICTASGSVTSHASIIAKSMNLPCIVCMGEELNDELDGKEAIVDGYDGILYIEPDDITAERVRETNKAEKRKHEMLHTLVGLENETIDGRKVSVMANILQLSQVEDVIRNDACGIGLFSSESLYLGEKVFPSDDTLFYNYRRAVEDRKGKEVMLLTYDVSAEKIAEIMGLKPERNPALGYRSLRVCLELQDVFRTQIRAMLRASAYGKMSIVLPMIIDIGEFRRARAIINEVKDKLREEGIPFDENVRIGAIIETPAAVMTSDLLAKEADFLSIGTTDLEQFTLALDKNSVKYDRIKPENCTAVLRMIKIVCDNAHKNGIPVILCGEMASDLSLTELFLAMDVDMFSVAPSKVLLLRKVIRSLDLGSSDHTDNLIAQHLQV